MVTTTFDLPTSLPRRESSLQMNHNEIPPSAALLPRGAETLKYLRLYLFRALQGDGSDAPSSAGLEVEGSPVALGSAEPHDPIALRKGLWMRWKSPPQYHSSKQNEAVGINGQLDIQLIFLYGIFRCLATCSTSLPYFEDPLLSLSLSFSYLALISILPLKSYIDI